MAYPAGGGTPEQLAEWNGPPIDSVAFLGDAGLALAAVDLTQGSAIPILQILVLARN